MHIHSALAVLALSLVSAQSYAQPAATLGRPDATLKEPFSQIHGIRELSDGRVLITDWIEERVVLIDAAFTRATNLGRTGAGPDEFRLPSALFPMSGDSTLLVDMGNQRLIVVAPSGRFVRTVPSTGPGTTSPAGVDDRGRIYFSVPAWSRDGGTLPSDSVEIFRLEPASNRRERIATIKGITMAQHQGPRLTPGFPMIAFATQDVWRVLPNGTVAIVRAGDYHVDLITASGKTSGPSYRYSAPPVTANDKLAFVREFNGSAPTSGKGTDGGLGHSDAMSEAQLAQMVRSNEFAPTLPMFERAILAHGGELWVLRGRHDGDPSVYDRFDQAAKRIGQVNVPAGRSVIGIGQRYVYVIAIDKDGVQTLERYSRPR